ncbi:MAG: 1-(5-phosphoribosyl)-5-[(5-phosphoribosylamino)methylideneamino]imidazole-4-carboxamide isomerase [Polyangiaceae bacterium]|nr:1-(5-phosphoribosyl)-5-[(5-phosphoribosylamino)methylideneamino]imidazole-4-carboxamide isomerase [Polyangiaceae bacterium]
MELIPAIDLLEGKAVRLLRGSYDAVTVYHDDPAQLAAEWKPEVRRLHVVDLEGSRDGKPVQLALIAKLVKAFGSGVQLGGGVRSIETLRAYFDAGVERVVLGTVAITQPELVEASIQEFPGRVILAVDARNGLVATAGWQHQSDVRAVDIVRRYNQHPLAAVLYTDIERDGTEVGPNIPETAALAREGGVPVIVSGGVGTLAHLTALVATGVAFSGVIVGRAVHEKRFTIAEALRALGQ